MLWGTGAGGAEINQISPIRNSEAEKYREDICLQTLFLLFKCANHRNNRLFISSANESLIGTLMAKGDVRNVFTIAMFLVRSHIAINIPSRT